MQMYVSQLNRHLTMTRLNYFVSLRVHLASFNEPLASCDEFIIDCETSEKDNYDL